ncbi:uncharacterized protein LOC123530158 [Mercenaria mercenaria]|uniref:uncharacterized protein LOC123530158 n=1 Tax=Mercenaria mercenaria TaxID=6596 RepID=UPI001E1D8881|nr:uncharacterized protein LOC123530158 [Mercenaria mercenaria]
MKGFLQFVLLGSVYVFAQTAAVDQQDEGEYADRSVILPGPRYQNCQWQVQNNPCANNPLNKLNFPHPSDNSKFIQCGTFSRLFIIQCPTGEVYDQATTTCVKPTTIVSQPLVNSLSGYGVSNPCTAINIQSGRIFFSLPSDHTRFIQCDQNGNAIVLTCPSQMTWDQNRQSCIFPTNSGVVLQPGTLGTGASTLTGYLSTKNPCTAQAISANALFFSHPDPTKFIQCDLQGNAFAQQCPSGLVWNQYLETCASQLATLTLGNTQNQFLTSGGGIAISG